MGWNFCQTDQFNSRCQDRNIVSVPADLGLITSFQSLAFFCSWPRLSVWTVYNITQNPITAVKGWNTKNLSQAGLYIKQTWEYNYTIPLAHRLVKKSLAVTFHSCFAVSHTAVNKKHPVSRYAVTDGLVLYAKPSFSCLMLLQYSNRW